MLSRLAMALVVTSASLLLAAQRNGSAERRVPEVISVEDGRGLAEALTRLQAMFLKPITFEEIPFENQSQLTSVTVERNDGTKQLLVNPMSGFTVTLQKIDATPYLASQTVLHAYKSAGRPGEYKVVQQANRVDVVPSLLLKSDGSTVNVMPVMSRPIVLRKAKRGFDDVIARIAEILSAESGFRVIPLTLPSHLLEQADFGANGEAAADVIQALGEKLGRTISFQLLYDPNDRAYYLNLHNVAPAPIPGVIDGPRRIIPAKVGPSDSPFFDISGHWRTP